MNKQATVKLEKMGWLLSELLQMVSEKASLRR